ncbi:hypothetical protein ACFQ3S_17345 [Mucilaginibacter terrae]
MTVSPIQSQLDMPDDVIALLANIENLLLVMTPIEPDEWKHGKTVSRTFTKAEYETVRNLLLAYKHLTR